MIYKTYLNIRGGSHFDVVPLQIIKKYHPRPIPQCHFIARSFSIHPAEPILSLRMAKETPLTPGQEQINNDPLIRGFVKFTASVPSWVNFQIPSCSIFFSAPSFCTLFLSAGMTSPSSLLIGLYKK